MDFIFVIIWFNSPFSEKLNEHNDLESLDLLVGDLPEEEELHEMFDLLEEDLNKNRVRILEK